MMHRFLFSVIAIIFGLHNILAQPFSTLKEEASAPFSYYKTSVDQLGFKDCPEGMAVTNGATFSSAHIAIEFLSGSELSSANKRVVTLENGYLPIIKFEEDKNNVHWKLQAFSVTDAFLPQNNLVTYITWTVTNTSAKKLDTRLGFNLISFFPDDTKNFLRHNMYCTPWWRDQFMKEEEYMRQIKKVGFENSNLVLGEHLILQVPANFPMKPSTSEANQWAGLISLNPGETKQVTFKMPFVPIYKKNKTVSLFNQNTNVTSLERELVAFWEKNLAQINLFNVSDEKLMNMYKTSYINLLTARDILEDKVNIIQRCNEFQYDYFYVRDNAYFARMYDMLGRYEDAKKILEPYFIKDIEGKDIHFRNQTGIYNKLCFDYWGQVLWAFGSHYRNTKDKALLERVYKLMPNHILDYDNMISLDSRGLWPKTWPYDNEHIDGHYTGHSFWVVLGLRSAIYMANAMGKKDDVKEWTKRYNQYLSNFRKELKPLTDKTGGYIPPGMDDPADGYDWDNASAGLYPFEAIDKNDPIVKATLETVRNYNFMEGISTYSGCNAWVAKQKVEKGDTLPQRGLHHYETFYVTNGNLILGEQKKVVEDLYSILMHTSSTHAGFEWRPEPWGNRDFDNNRPPHGWMAARFIELVRNMLVREEGADVHLFSAISPQWVKRNEKIVVTKAPTYWGDVSYTASFPQNKIQIDLINNIKLDTGKIFFHIPWFVKPNEILLDGKKVESKGDKIEISSGTRQIQISWDEKTLPTGLSYEDAVKNYLNKYYNKPPQANYGTLFPELAIPGYHLDKTKNELSLFSPDGYADVYYTSDGTQPSKKSSPYKNNISTKNIKVIKAICIDKEGIESDCRTIQLNVE